MSTPLPAALGEWSGFLLAKAAQAVAARVEAELAPLELRSRTLGCLLLLAGEGPLSQQAIAERQRVDRTTVTAIVDELEGLGLVERRRHPTDRRAHLVALTRAGRRRLARARETGARAEAEALGALTPQEREQLRLLLARVVG
jgi:DNA-binding MarR family transcriptional regulator